MNRRFDSTPRGVSYKRADSIALFYAMLLFAIALGMAYAQTPVPQPTNLPFIVQTLPAAIPTSSTCIVGPKSVSGCLYKITPSASSTDPYLCAADFTATGQTITMQDGNGVVWIVGGGALGTSGSPTGWEWHAADTSSCRVFPNGLYITSSGAGVTGKVTIRFNQ